MGDRIQRDETMDAATRFDRSTRDSAITYQRLRSPQQHGESLQFPSLRDVDRVWHQNFVATPTEANIGDYPLTEIQSLGRKEVIKCATRYSQSYTDIDVSDRSATRIIMAGHQPELFHSGVWYKNFVLSELGARFNATPINLIVDNDICGSTSIQYPIIDGEHVRVGSLPIVHAGPNVPFEVRSINGLEFFKSFQTRVADGVRDQVQDPIIDRLWPNVMRAVELLSGDGGPLLGQSIAAGRHRFENEIGLRTLEVPVSQISQTKAFAIFVKSILQGGNRFQTAYNQTLSDYRRVHRIRSRSHPVPELEVIDGWREIPFWVWQSDRPNRRRIFTKQVQNAILLSDRLHWKVEFKTTSFVEQFCELSQQGVAVRPRALMTTMFSRLILSDLFLHGIGGAKYDQLTDVIISRFFAVKPPGFLTLSATMKLPTSFEIIHQEDWVRSSQLIRDLKFHPESHIALPSPEAQELIQQKRDWTVGPRQSERSKQKHDSIANLNLLLQQHLDVNPSELLASRIQLTKTIRASKIADSREYSFCLFPNSLMGELISLATV